MNHKIFTLLLFSGLCSALPDLTPRAAPISADLIKAVQELAADQPKDQVDSAISAIKKEAPSIDKLSGEIGLSARATSAKTRKASLACQVLKYVFPSNYVDESRNKTAYTEAIEYNWSSNCDLPAACVITPENPVQVALALKVVTLTGSRFAVRSGGHNANPGFGSVDGSGVLFDIKKLRTLKMSGDKKVLTTGAGNQWADVHTYADKYEKSVTGGRHLQVGVSGVLLGGGYPVFSSLYGMACDNVKNFEVVLGSSKIVNANANSNPDLFKVLKGGGNNFGIVTSFELYTTPTRQIWYRGFNLNATAGNHKEILKAAAQVQKNMEKDPKAQLLFNLGFGAFIIIFIYAEPTVDPAVFRPLTVFPQMGDIPNTPPNLPPTNGTLLDFHKLQTNPDYPGYREAVGMTSEPDGDMNLDMYNLYYENHKFTNDEVLGILKWQPLSSHAVRFGQSRGGNILGLKPVAQSFMGTPVQWLNEKRTAEAHKYIVKMEGLINGAAKKHGKYLEYIFANDGATHQNVMRHYGAANLEKMKAASRKYDPAQVFQKLQFGGYLVSKA